MISWHGATGMKRYVVLRMYDLGLRKWMRIWINKREEGIMQRLWKKPEEKSQPIVQVFYKGKLGKQFKKLTPDYQTSNLWDKVCHLPESQWSQL